MSLSGKYKAKDKMCDLICQNYPMLLVMSRFGIPLGFGEKSIQKVCEQNKVDVNTFLTVVNFLLEDAETIISPQDISASSLLNYLENSHNYYLDFRLPSIRRKLIEAIDYNNEASFAILKFFDGYVEEVRKHLNYEDETVFPYIHALINGEPLPEYKIDIFSKQHDQVEAKLTELKNILIKYYPANSSNDLNSVLFDIFSCEQDLASHNLIEDNLLVPMITEWENKLSNHE